MKIKSNYFKTLIAGFIFLIISGLTSAANIDIPVTNTDNGVKIADNICPVGGGWTLVRLKVGGWARYYASCEYGVGARPHWPQPNKLCPRSGPWQKINGEWRCGKSPSECIFTNELTPDC